MSSALTLAKRQSVPGVIRRLKHIRVCARNTLCYLEQVRVPNRGQPSEGVGRTLYW